MSAQAMELQSLMGFFTLEGGADRPRSVRKVQAKAPAKSFRTLSRSADETSGEFTRF
jgi:hypothetical protein